MKIDEFKLVRYLEKSNGSARHQLSASDCESFDVGEILSQEQMLELRSLKLAYSESQGSPILREEIAKLSTNVGPEEVVVSAPSGGQRAQSSMCLSDKGF